MTKEHDLEMNAEAIEFVKNYIQECYDNRDKYFGNARFVRKIVEETIKQQNLRMASIPKAERTAAMMRHVTIEDVKNIKTIAQDFKPKSRLGFRL